LLLFLLVVLSLPTVGYFIIRQNSVQQYIVRKLTAKISAFLGTSVSMSAAEIDLFNNVTLRDFCVKSPQHDTILYTSSLQIKLNTFTLSSKFLEFKKVVMTKPKINFYVDSANVINFQFIINKLEAKDTTSSARSMIVSIRDIYIRDADFRLKSYYNSHREYGINFMDLHLKPLNIHATNFRIDHGVSMNVRDFSASDQSGFVVRHLSTMFKVDKENMVFNHVGLTTSQSHIKAHQVRLRYKNIREFKTGIFGKRVKLTIDLDPSEMSADDIAYFLPVVKDYHLKATISGTFRGVLNDLKAKDITILYGKQTRIKANVDINGLPDIMSSFLHVDIKSLYTTPSDIESIGLPHSKNKRIVLPDNFRTISYLTYKGKFTGFFNDFVAYGTISSNLGKLESDLSLKSDSIRYVSFNGQLKADQFDIGKFLNKSGFLGKISFNAMADGVVGDIKSTRAKLNGMVTSFVINNYNYQNVKIDGTFSDNTYDGSLSISEPNLDFNFLGKVNLSNRIPIFNFKANIKSARLYPLNIDRKDTGSFVSLYITADFEGNNIDNLDGEIKLWNSTFKRAGKQIQINDFLLFTKNINDTNRIILRSDLADAEVWGTYRFKQLPGSFIAFVRNYLPSVVANQPVEDLSDNNFKFEVDFKNTRQLTDFFSGGLYMSKDSRLTGSYYPAKNAFDFYMRIPLLQHKSKKWYNVYLNGKTLPDHTFSLVSGCNDLKISNKLDFKNLSIETVIRNDSVSTGIRWNNWDSISYRGNLALVTSFKPSKNHAIPIINMEIAPSQFVLQDTVWSIKPGSAIIDSSGLTIRQFVLTHNNQTINIFGSTVKNQEHTLSAVFTNVDLGNISTILNNRILSLNGIMNGNVNVSNLGTNPIFRASLTLDSLIINHERLGKTKVSAVYENTDKEIKIEASSDRGSIKTLDIKGTYGTVSRHLDFDIDLDNLKMSVFEPYVSNIFSDIKGGASGSVQLSGTILSPKLNGSVRIQQGAFTVNYLKTSYNFAQTVNIVDNAFLLKNIEINDSKGSKATVNGRIEYRKLQDIYTDIKVNANNFEFLNTKEKDNNLYYGHGYASGTVRIQTAPQSVVMTIEASTDQGTVISIPISTRINQAEQGFVRIVNKHATVVPFEQYEIDNVRDTKKNTASSTNFKLDCILHVTPKASAQIVFDPKSGEMITGTGRGDLNLKLDGGNFTMYGKYIIDEGTYWYKLQNVINKTFIVDKGGSITWDGDPVDATIDIKAIYKLNASLYQLTGDEQYKKPISVECVFYLTDKLMSPSIRYDIDLPKADQETLNTLYSNITNEDSKSEQFLALLIGNNFMPSQSSNSSNSGSGLGINAARTTGLEFLSNQFSRMISQFSKDFELGFNYTPGDEGVTTGQAEMAFSTQILNDRVTINGNVDVGGEQISNTTKTANENIVGEGSVELKITENGKLRLKAFNRSNQNSYYSKTTQTSPYTQGVGVFYQEEFNSFFGLLKHYFNKITGRKEDPPKPTPETEDEDTDE
jgi:hypothetical protein